MHRSGLLLSVVAVLFTVTTVPAQTGDTRDDSAPRWGPPSLLEPSAPAHRKPAVSLDGAFTAFGPDAGALIVGIDSAALKKAFAEPGGVLIRDFPLDGAHRADLEVERFWVTTPATRFVVGAGTGVGEPFAFDPSSVLLLRGTVSGHCESRVYIALAPGMANGIIELGQGLGSYGVSSRDRRGLPLGDDLLTVVAAPPGGPGALPFCNIDEHDEPVHTGHIDGGPRRGLRQLQLAVETDHEFFQLFGDETATATYLVELYGAVSDLYMREINVRIDLAFARVWPQANEPFEASLNDFQNYWEANMSSVQRDDAQMFSGRGDLPGGVAYVSALCSSSGYAFCGNAVGYFVDPVSANVFNYDPQVTAHELGHNCGTLHTHDYALDTCDQVATVPRRGTIMSYCNQTVSGAMSVMDMTFHKVTRNAMLDFLPDATCVVFDCNQNGRSDTIDIALGFSVDANANGIPDECEDCNGNHILDSIDISAGTSHDLNLNGIPDECEPDCNQNGVPDDRDILLGTSQDLYGDGVPDECDADLNNNGVSDYNEIMANMPLDKDRNRVLDSKQDCDHDGTPDLVELEGAWDGWAASLDGSNLIREYHSVTGVLMTSATSQVTQPQDLVITPSRRILVTSADTNRVVEFDRTGALVRTLVAAGSGGLGNPGQMLLTPSGTLLVASRANNSVLEYDLNTGAFVRAFVTSGSGGLAAPFGLALGPSGNLFVSSLSGNRVLEYNGTTGAFVRVLVAAGSGGLSGARGLVFKPDGNLVVASYNNDQVKEYNGATGAFVRDWLVTGLVVDGPWCLRRGPDGMIYISRNLGLTDTHLTRARIFIFDPRNGNFVRAYVQGQDSALSQPTGFDFMPGDMTDCNANRIPDSCDIASGVSTDINMNGIPDECERICYSNCDLSTAPPVLNVNDFICFQNQFAGGQSYANCDGSTTPPVLNVNDFICFQTRFAAGCQ